MAFENDIWSIAHKLAAKNKRNNESFTAIRTPFKKNSNNNKNTNQKSVIDPSTINNSSFVRYGFVNI